MGQIISSGRNRPLDVTFQVECSRVDTGLEFVIAAQKKEGSWEYSVEGWLGEVRLLPAKREGGSRGWHIKSHTSVAPKELTYTTAIYVVTVPDSVMERTSFLFARTFDMPGIYWYEIKLAEWIK